jgi:hypothetical protein
MKEHTISEQVILSLADRSNFLVTKIANRRCKVIILVNMSDSVRYSLSPLRGSDCLKFIYNLKSKFCALELS